MVAHGSSSIEQEDRMYRVVSEREESSPEISQTEQTSHSRHEKMLAAQAHGNQGNLRMTGAVTTGEEDNDEFSDDGYFFIEIV